MPIRPPIRASVPRLHVTTPGRLGETHTVVIVLPGGRAADRRPARWRHLSSLRMIPLARAATKGAATKGAATQGAATKGAAKRDRDPGVAVWRLLYRYRGWNEPDRDPVRDVGWALEQVRERHPGAAVILIGHSMGGRTALWAAGDPSVVGVCGLAPWIEPPDPFAQLAGRTVLVAHGDRDRITDPAQSRRYAGQAARVTSAVRYVAVDGDGHAMLRRWGRWNALVAGFVEGVLADRRSEPAGRTGPVG